MEVKLHAVVARMEADDLDRNWSIDLTVPSWPKPPSYLPRDCPIYNLNKLFAHKSRVYVSDGFNDNREDKLQTTLLESPAVYLTGELTISPTINEGSDQASWSRTIFTIKKGERAPAIVERPPEVRKRVAEIRGSTANAKRHQPLLTEQEKEDIRRNPALYTIPAFNPKTEGLAQNPIVIEASQPRNPPSPSSNTPQTNKTLPPRTLKRTHSSSSLSSPSIKETKHQQPTPAPTPASPPPAQPTFLLHTAVVTHATLKHLTIYYPVLRPIENETRHRFYPEETPHFPQTLSLSVLPSAWPTSVTAPWEDTGLDPDLILSKEIRIHGHIESRKKRYMEKVVWIHRRQVNSRDVEKEGTELLFVAEKIEILGDGMGRKAGPMGGGYDRFEPGWRWDVKERKWIDTWSFIRYRCGFLRIDQVQGLDRMIFRGIANGDWPKA